MGRKKSPGSSSDIDNSELRNFFTHKEWNDLKKEEPFLAALASASWQDPANFSSNAVTAEAVVDIFPYKQDGVKPSDTNWRKLQSHSWNYYKTFGPLQKSVNRQADYTVGAGFEVFSTVQAINEWLQDLFYGTRNEIGFMAGFITRMLTEAELFVLIALDENGDATVRNLEPDAIGKGETDKGMITDLEDVNQTIFYKVFMNNQEEYIPDARFITDPEYMAERAKLIKDKYDPSKIAKITKGTNAKVGGYRRFILHWKNLTGVLNILRDTSGIATTIEWINLYVMSLKWQLDHQKALTAYTVEVAFEDTRAGQVAWHVWSKMTQAQKDATNLTKPLAPGSRVFTMPGMTLKIHAPQINPLSGTNQDLLNLSGSGSGTPQDMWSGQSVGATYSSLKASRPPVMMDTENLQWKTEKWLIHRLLRYCITAKIKHGGKVLSPIGKAKKLKIEESYKKKWVDSYENGNPKIVEIDVEPCMMIEVSFPTLRLDDNPQATVNAYLGSKHAGLRSIGISDSTLAKRAGFTGLSRERRLKALEEDMYGEVLDGSTAESMQEQKYADSGVDGSPTSTESGSNGKQPAETSTGTDSPPNTESI